LRNAINPVQFLAEISLLQGYEARCLHLVVAARPIVRSLQTRATWTRMTHWNCCTDMSQARRPRPAVPLIASLVLIVQRPRTTKPVQTGSGRAHLLRRAPHASVAVFILINVIYLILYVGLFISFIKFHLFRGEVIRAIFDVWRGFYYQ
jgi:hypothetical protein